MTRVAGRTALAISLGASETVQMKEVGKGTFDENLEFCGHIVNFVPHRRLGIKSVQCDVPVTGECV